MSTRRVRRLRVSAENEDDARRAATLLTDALRTASLPLADQGRLVVVRKLPLGRISVRVSAPSLALQIERVMREIVSQAVAYDLPAAAEANAVAFADRSDAIISLARLHARAAPATEWFWSDVVRGWRADVSREERWRLILDAAHAVPEAAVVAAAVIDHAVGAGAVDALLSAVTPGQGERWLRMEGWTSVEPELVSATPRASPALPRRHAAIVDRWRGRWGSTDDRLVWVSTMLAVSENRALVADTALPSRIASSLRRAVEREPTLQAEAGPPVHGERASSGAPPELRSEPSPSAVANRTPREEPSRAGTEPAEQPLSAESASADRLQPPSAAPRDSAAVDGRTASPAREALAAGESRVDIEPERVARKTLSGQYTLHAGLLFLVPILDRLEFAAFLAEHPELVEVDFAARLIAFIGERVGLRAEDPLAIAFRREPLESDAAFDLDQRLIAWTTAVRRWCRRQARMGLCALIRRPGRVHISRTHLDACFDLSQIDVRLRRLALDVDPGWVPWIGRVVQFNYLPRDEHSY